MHDQEKPPLNELAHYGKKGMKWGVRKGYVERQQLESAFGKKVAKGEGSLTERVGNRVLAGEFGTKKGAGIRAEAKAAHAKRLKTGNEKATDLIQMYGTFTLMDIRRQPKDYGKSKNPTEFGVKKSYVDRKTEQGKAGIRLAKGEGQKGDRIKTGEFLTTKKGQAKRGMANIDHAKRIKNGKASLADKLAMYNQVTLQDLGRQPKGYGK